MEDRPNAQSASRLHCVEYSCAVRRLVSCQSAYHSLLSLTLIPGFYQESYAKERCHAELPGQPANAFTVLIPAVGRAHL
jgi:hypothetical protein